MNQVEETNSLPSATVVLGGLAFAAAIINGGIGAIDFGSDAVNIAVPLGVSALTGFLAFITGQRSRDGEVNRANARALNAINRAESALDLLQSERAGRSGTDPREVM